MSTLRDEINPFFMYGTAWKEDRTEELTFMALQSGFRAIDTANQRKHYFEEGVGNGITQYLESSQLKRKDLFIQTKFTYKEGQDHHLPYNPKAEFPSQVKQSFESSLHHLQIEYIDSYILHGPSTHQGLSPIDFEVWQAMEDLQNEGKTRYIGVSNINYQQLQLLLDKASIKPAFVQNRCFAQMGWDYHVRQICNEHNIIYQGFSLLTANRNYIMDPRIRKLAIDYNKPITSVIFSFAKKIGMLPLTGTTNQDHMDQDLSGIDIELTNDEMKLIEMIAAV